MSKGKEEEEGGCIQVEVVNSVFNYKISMADMASKQKSAAQGEAVTAMAHHKHIQYIIR